MAAGSLAMPTLLVALLACATSRMALAAGGTACVGAVCLMGSCKEVTLLPFINITTYECDCFHGWSWPNVTLPLPLPLTVVPLLPCAIPTCLSTAEFTCYRPKPPNAANATLDNPCSYNDCGSEGACVREEGPQFRCQCDPGATNLNGNPSLPCINKNCAVDENGCPVSRPATPPPPPPSSSTAPPGNANGAPSSNKGSVSWQNRLRLSLLLGSLAALHAVVL